MIKNIFLELRVRSIKNISYYFIEFHSEFQLHF